MPHLTQSPIVGGNFSQQTMNINDLDFHDSAILSVSENTQQHYLDFLLEFPIKWEDNIFELRILRFYQVIFYTIDEIPFFGQPTILEIINFGQVNKSWGTGQNLIEAKRTKIEIQTNAGNRIIEYEYCNLLNITELIDLAHTKYKDKSIIDIFEIRDGLETKVELKNGKLISIWNIAFGYGVGEEFAHITTNISPNIDHATIDHFLTNEISKILTNGK